MNRVRVSTHEKDRSLVGTVMAGWKIVRAHFTEGQRIISLICPKCENVKEMYAPEVHKNKGRRLAFHCEHCNEFVGTKDLNSHFRPGTHIGNFIVVAQTRDHERRATDLALECLTCGSAKSITTGHAHRVKTDKRTMTCNQCILNELQGKESNGWKLIDICLVRTERDQIRWAVTHSCGYSTSWPFKLTMQVFTAGYQQRCANCTLPEKKERKKYKYKKPPNEPKPLAHKLHRPQVELTPWQQKYVRVALSTRRREVLGSKMPETVRDRIVELYETEIMCSKWNDERCREEIEMLKVKPKFNLELRQDYDWYKAGDVTI